MAQNDIHAPVDWYDGFFEGDYLDHVALQFEAERTAREAGFVAERLGVEPGARVLDLACGHGRIALELARRGFRVTGLDLSARSVRIAREAAERDGLDVEWVHADRLWDITGDGVVWLQEHEVDVLAGRNRARWTFIRPDGSRSEIVHSVRMYTARELATMLERAGLQVAEAWGDWDASELTRESRRTILLARKSSA